MKTKIYFNLCCILISIIVCINLSYSEIREPSVSGAFYPSNPQELSKMINSFFEKVNENKLPSRDCRIYGIIVPHAGYVYSGQVASYGFKCIQGRKIDTVIIIGQSHRFPLKKCALYSGTIFRTPLGDVTIDKELVRDIINSSKELFEENNYVHLPEHSIEVEVPFLQSVLTKFRLVGILIPNVDIDLCKNIAEKIVSVLKTEKYKKRNIIFVISTDMSHYPKYEDATYIDNESLNSMTKYNPVLLKRTIDNLMSKNYSGLDCVFCGEEAVYVGMYATKLVGADKVNILKYANSGDTEYGDKNRVVGYCAVAFLKESEKIKSGSSIDNNAKTTTVEKKGDNNKKMEQFSISPKNQKLLLDLARRTIREYIKSKKIIPFQTTDKELLTPSAVFVTLTINHQLRGCIGTTIPQLPLYNAVQQMAIAASFEDYRFRPVTEDELKDIKIEISVLSPLTRVKSADEIKENVHGVVVRRDNRSGLFLPQVWEHFTRKEDFLSELCSQKAGLDSNAWKDNKTELYVFTVFAFEEK